MEHRKALEVLPYPLDDDGLPHVAKLTAKPRLRDHLKMLASAPAPAAAPSPIQALQLLPLGQSAQGERNWLDDTLAWLKSVSPAARTQRLRDLSNALQENPAAKRRFQQLWKDAYAPRVFAEAALPEATSLLRALSVRLNRRMLPQLADDVDLYSALQHAHLDDDDASWIANLSNEDINPWRDILGQSSADALTAIRLLALRAAATGLSRSVMSVMPHRYETDSPFFALVEEAQRLVESQEAASSSDALREAILQCRRSSSQAHDNLEERGVSADLVFRLDLVVAQLDRIDALLNLCEHPATGPSFTAGLISAIASERGVHSLLRNSVNRVARRVVAHTGKSGEHYIAGSKSAWTAMGYGAIGAGAITAFTALFKYLFAGMPWAPLWIGIAHSLNYTLSFVLMQFLGWRLASKMPSMTAAALCDAMENDDGMRSEVNLVTAITRTQTVVTIGNLLGAIPLAMLLDAAIRWRTGKPFLSEASARHGLLSLHPLLSWTILFASLTGCFLWLSSLFAGWAANWLAVHRLPAAIAQNRKLRRLFGPGVAVALAEKVKKHFSGIVGYVTLGLMLGLLPFVGVFAGIPLEVRHITLASASLAYDVSALLWRSEIPWPEIGWACVGLAAVAVLNFSVSFALGLWLAIRARNLNTAGRRTLMGALRKEFLRCPSRFLWSHEAEPFLTVQDTESEPGSVSDPKTGR